MAFLKRNLFVLICLVVGLGSLGLCYLGCSTYEGINKSLDQAKTIGQGLKGGGKVPGRKQPVAPPDLKAQEVNIKTVQGAVKEVRDVLDLDETTYLAVMQQTRRVLAVVGVEDLNLRGNHILLSLDQAGQLARDDTGLPAVRICSFELLRRTS